MQVPVVYIKEKTKKLRASRIRATPIKSNLDDKIYTGPVARYVTTGKKIKIRALYNSGIELGSISAIERVSISRIQEIVNDPNMDFLDGQVTEATKKYMGANFLHLADVAMQVAQRPDKLEAMNAFQSTIIASTAYDKFRLSENLSTANISVQGIVAHLELEKEELKKSREAILQSIGGEVKIESANSEQALP